jgi:DNA polymerase-3 subunit delta
VKAAKGSIGRAVDRPDPDIRFYLFYGPDEAQSQALGERLLKALGAEKAAVASGAIRSSPAALVDEAGAMSLFGGKRAVWIQPSGEEIFDGVEALLAAPAVESPVIAIAGQLRKSSALLKLAESDGRALAYISYVPEGLDADRMIEELAQAEGLRPQPGVSSRIAEAVGGDRRMAAQELAKLALYVGASVETPRELRHDALDEVGTDMGGNAMRIADLALAGDLDALGSELADLPEGGGEAIPVIRSLQRRLLMLAPLRVRVESGQRPGDVVASAGKSVFFKDKAVVTQMLRQWDAAGLARVAERAGELERAMMLRGIPQLEALGEELTAIARQAARRR